MPRLLEAELRAMGVPAENITVIVDEQQAIEGALRLARAGDLLLIFADAVSRSWKQIIYFRPEREAGGAATPRPPTRAPSLTTPETTASGLPEGAELIQDERGVRIARTQDD